MVDIWFTAATELAFMGLGPEQVSIENVGDVFWFKIGFKNRAQVADLKPVPNYGLLARR